MIGHRKYLALLLAAGAAFVLAHFQAPPVAAEAFPAAPHERSVTAADGRTLLVGHRNEKAQRVASGLFSTRKASVDNEAYATISGRGTARLTEAELTIGYHIGCAVALAKISVEVKSLLQAFGLNAEPGPFLRPSTIVVKPDERMPPRRNSSTVYPGMKIEPEVTVSLAMGSIADIRLATAPVRNGRAAAGVRHTDITVEGCVGPVAIRSYAVLTTKSTRADESVVVYGEPILL